MFHKNILMICDYFNSNIYIFVLKTMKIISFSMKIILNLKSAGDISKIVQIW